MSLVELASNLASGGLVGGLLGIGNRFLDMKARREERGHEVEMTRLASAARATVEEWTSFRASQEAGRGEAEAPTYKWAAAIRTLTRPLLTWALVGVSAYVYASAPAEVRAQIGQDLLMLTGTALGWWFGSRPTLGSSRR
jgi:hypothetical protein